MPTVATKPPRHLARTAASFVGLSIFNLFMVIPALVYASLLASVYVSAFAFYIGGVAVTASGLSGQNELALQGPLRQLMELTDSRFDTQQEEDEALRWKVAITSRGLQVFKDPAKDPATTDGEPASRNSRIWDRAEAVATGDLRITTDLDKGAQTTQTLVGLGMVLGGIGLCLISILLTRYTVIGMRRYAAMNVSLLRGH
jgi:uncharacterized membrane protein